MDGGSLFNSRRAVNVGFSCRRPCTIVVWLTLGEYQKWHVSQSVVVQCALPLWTMLTFPTPIGSRALLRGTYPDPSLMNPEPGTVDVVQFLAQRCQRHSYASKQLTILPDLIAIVIIEKPVCVSSSLTIFDGYLSSPSWQLGNQLVCADQSRLF